LINEKKVGLMTKVAVFEKEEEHHDLAMCKYFPEDYVKFNCLRTLVSTTVCFFMIFGLYIMTNFEEILNQLNDMDYMAMIKKIMTYYVLFALIFEVIGFIVYNIRYILAKPELIEYNHNLKRLLAYYGLGKNKKFKDDEFDEIDKSQIKVRSGIGMDEDDFDDYEDYEDYDE